MYRRRLLRLIRPRLQLRLILVFLGLSALSLLLQLSLFMTLLTRAAVELPHDGLLLLDELNGLLVAVFLISFAMLLPLTFLVGILSTHRFAGPLYRFERFLEEVASGSKPPACRLRKGDELQELCTLLNQVTEPLRRREPSHAAPNQAKGHEQVSAPPPPFASTAAEAKPTPTAAAD